MLKVGREIHQPIIIFHNFFSCIASKRKDHSKSVVEHVKSKAVRRAKRQFKRSDPSILRVSRHFEYLKHRTFNLQSRIFQCFLSPLQTLCPEWCVPGLPGSSRSRARQVQPCSWFASSLSGRSWQPGLGRASTEAEVLAGPSRGRVRSGAVVSCGRASDGEQSPLRSRRPNFWQSPRLGSADSPLLSFLFPSFYSARGERTLPRPSPVSSLCKVPFRLIWGALQALPSSRSEHTHARCHAAGGRMAFEITATFSEGL